MGDAAWPDGKIGPAELSGPFTIRSYGRCNEFYKNILIIWFKNNSFFFLFRITTCVQSFEFVWGNVKITTSSICRSLGRCVFVLVRTFINNSMFVDYNIIVRFKMVRIVLTRSGVCGAHIFLNRTPLVGIYY